MTLNEEVYNTVGTDASGIGYGSYLQTMLTDGKLKYNTPWDVSNIYVRNKGCFLLGSGFENNRPISILKFTNFEDGNNTRAKTLDITSIDDSAIPYVSIRLMRLAYNADFSSGLPAQGVTWGNNVSTTGYREYWDIWRPVTNINFNNLVYTVYCQVLDNTDTDNPVYYTYSLDYVKNNLPNLYRFGFDGNQYLVNFSIRAFYGNAGERERLTSSYIFPVCELYFPSQNMLVYWKPLSQSYTQNDQYFGETRSFYYNTSQQRFYYPSITQNPYSGRLFRYTMHSNANNANQAFISTYPYPQSIDWNSLSEQNYIVNGLPNNNKPNFGIFMDYYPTLNTNRPIYYMSGILIEQTMNGLGVWWVDTEDSIQSETGKNCTDPHMHIGIIDEEGFTNGSGFSGSEAQNAIQSNWENYTDSPFDYTIPDNFGNLVSDISLNSPNISPLNTFNSNYLISANTLNQFASWLWNPDGTVFDDIVNGLKLFGQNPIEALTSLKLFPFDLTPFFSTTSSNITMGRTNSGINADLVTGTKTAVIDMGSVLFNAKYNNFLDYSPYTKCMLYLPYCGTVDISPTDVVGKTVSVKYIIDFVTGGCTAVVYFDNIPYVYKTGIIGFNIPVTSTDSAALTSSVISGTLNAVNSGVNVFSGNLREIPNFGGSLYQLSTSAKQTFQQSGASTGYSSQYQPQNAYFIVSRPSTNIPKTFPHTFGYSANTSGRIRDFSGFTICKNVDTSGIPDATAEEREEIKRILESGFYA